MKKNVIGIDVSKDSLDFCILDSENHKKASNGVIENNEKSIKKWLTKLDKKKYHYFF